MEIRKERETDYAEVENVIREAFWNKYRPGCFEHYVVHKLRNEKVFIKDLDFVVTENEKIIGSIVYSKGSLKTENGKIDAVTFGPVAILPEYQKKGYGEKLINHTLALAKEKGIPFVVITGDHDYYKKYGFVSASKYNIFYEGANKNDEAPYFMIKVLNEKFTENISGEYSDPQCFNASEEEVDEFDKNFKVKEKKKLPDQIF